MPKHRRLFLADLRFESAGLLGGLALGLLPGREHALELSFGEVQVLAERGGVGSARLGRILGERRWSKREQYRKWEFHVVVLRAVIVHPAAEMQIVTDVTWVTVAAHPLAAI